jgi:hypothetical protein
MTLQAVTVNGATTTEHGVCQVATGASISVGAVGKSWRKLLQSSYELVLQ